MKKTTKAHGYVIEYWAINDTISDGFRGEYTILDTAGEPVSGCRTAQSSQLPLGAEADAEAEGVARAQVYASTPVADHDKLRAEDEALYYARGGRILGVAF